MRLSLNIYGDFMLWENLREEEFVKHRKWLSYFTIDTHKEPENIIRAYEDNAPKSSQKQNFNNSNFDDKLDMVAMWQGANSGNN